MKRIIKELDWFVIITDICRVDLCLRDIAACVGVSTSTVAGWKTGAQPRHGAGEALITLWCHVTLKERDAAPVAFTCKHHARDICGKPKRKRAKHNA